MKVEVKGNDLVITLPFNKTGNDSKSGKTKVHATTNGNQASTVEVNGKQLIVGVNAYTPKG